jgi:membrane-bound inhibitor of C-type lysozyme
MRDNLTVKIIVTFIALIVTSCGKQQSKNAEFTYQNGNQKVEIQILNGNDYLEYEKPTETNFILTNIEPNTFAVYGAGIRILGTKNDTLKTEIKVPNNYLENDTLNVKVRFGKKPEENHEFNIPMKRAK